MTPWDSETDRPPIPEHMFAGEIFLEILPKWLDSCSRTWQDRDMPTRNYNEATNERRCTRCHLWMPQTTEFFYYRPSSDRFGLCHPCRAEYVAERTAVRREARQSGRVTRRTERRFGVEIEFIHHSRATVAYALRDAGINVEIENYNHRTRSHWKLTTDASVSRGYELVSPPLKGRAGKEEVIKVCEILVAAGATVNRTCGLHVHHEAKDFTGNQFARLFEAWSAQQETTDQFLAPSRRGDHAQWCGRLREYEVRDIAQRAREFGDHTMTRTAVRSRYNGFSGFDRYRSINVTSFPKYGTVEIRQHQGTLDGDKIVAWIDYGQAMFQWARTTDEVNVRLSVQDLLTHLMSAGLEASSALFLGNRALELAA